jgi:hypothetical protein
MGSLGGVSEKGSVVRLLGPISTRRSAKSLAVRTHEKDVARLRPFSRRVAR